MAPKKKPANKAEDGPDPFEEFVKRYNKNQKENDTPKIKEVADYIQKIDEGEEVKCWNFREEFDPMSFRIFCFSLRQANFLGIDAIRVWKCRGGDESVRSVCYYLESQPAPNVWPNVQDLWFTDNDVTVLGCEFLGRTLGPKGNPIVNLLRLDYNKFGTPGVEKLSLGLAQNATLRHLSLQYCNIGEDGGEYIAHILMFIRCALEKLELCGNYLGNRGVVDVLHGARRTKCLREIDLFDNKFNDDVEPGTQTSPVIDALRDLFANNQNLKRYHLHGNQISEDGAHQLVNGMIGNNHLELVKVPERCSMKTWEALEFQLNSAKGKKGKKGKKK